MAAVRSVPGWCSGVVGGGEVCRPVSVHSRHSAERSPHVRVTLAGPVYIERAISAAQPLAAVEEMRMVLRWRGRWQVDGGCSAANASTGNFIIGDPSYIVTIWKVVFANKSRKLGWIWMKLGMWGWGLKRLSLARFQRNRAMGFGESAKKWVAEAFFCHVYDALPLLPLSLDRFPPNFPRTRVQVVACDTWFHIREQFPLRDRISRKTVFLGYFRVPCLCSAYGSGETFCDA